MCVCECVFCTPFQQKYINKSVDKQKTRGNGKVDKRLRFHHAHAHIYTHTHTHLAEWCYPGGWLQSDVFNVDAGGKKHTHSPAVSTCLSFHFMRPDLLISFISFFFYYYYMCSHLKRSRCDANPRVSDSEYADWGSITPFSAFRRNGKETLYSHKLNCATLCQTTDSCLAGCFNWLHCRLSNNWLVTSDRIWMCSYFSYDSFWKNSFWL